VENSLNDARCVLRYDVACIPLNKPLAYALYLTSTVLFIPRVLFLPRALLLCYSRLCSALWWTSPGVLLFFFGASCRCHMFTYTPAQHGLHVMAVCAVSLSMTLPPESLFCIIALYIHFLSQRLGVLNIPRCTTVRSVHDSAPRFKKYYTTVCSVRGTTVVGPLVLHH
jgi:hypothetical protein